MCARIIHLHEVQESRQKAKTHRTTEQKAFFEEQRYRGMTAILASFKEDKTKSFGTHVTKKNFKQYFESKINASLIEQGLIEPSFFLCSLYVAQLLSNTLNTEPRSWYAIDYHEKSHHAGNVHEFKEGGDMCFLMASVFPEQTHRRLVDIQYYKKMGVTFYLGLYTNANIEIGYHMGKQFDVMVDITHDCIESIQ